MRFRLACLLATFATGCGGSEEAAAKRSAAAVTRAVERLRNAANPAKSARLAELARIACSGPEVCEARDACAAAYALHVEGMGLTQAAKLQLTTGQDLEAAKVLGAAELKLREAASKVADCTDREASLRRRHRL